MELSELFYNCAFVGGWKEVGDDVNYKFVEKGDILYIYFQGSNSITDWVRNFLFPAKPYKDMGIPYRVHRGFLSAWKEVEDIIINKITEKIYYKPSTRWEYKWKHIIVVGYSHGGALAAFCHECVWFHRPDMRNNFALEGYGFEAPRIYAGWHVKKELKERWATFKVIRCNNDVVTHCPPWLFRFIHVGKIIKIKGDTSLVKSKWLPKCVKSHYPEVVYDGLKKYESD